MAYSGASKNDTFHYAATPPTQTELTLLLQSDNITKKNNSKKNTKFMKRPFQKAKIKSDNRGKKSMQEKRKKGYKDKNKKQ